MFALGVFQNFQCDVFDHAFHLGLVLQHVRGPEMSFQVSEGFPLFHNRDDVRVCFLDGYFGGEVHGGGIFHASLFIQDLGDVPLEDF